jgi:glycosyltransferase involved in cell wall biosynthesis
VKIAYVIDSLDSGGAQRQLTETACCLAKRSDLEVRVVAYHAAGFFAPRLREGGVPVTVVRKARRLDAAFPIRLARWLEAFGPDVVHAFMLPPSTWTHAATRLIPRRRRPAFIAAERTDRIGLTRVSGLIERVVYRGADAVTVNSTKVAEIIHRKLGITTRKIHYIPNGIDLDAWDRRCEEPCPIALDRSRLQIAMIGGLRPEKNHHIVLAALEGLPPETAAGLQVWFIGDETAGPAFAENVRAEIKRRGLGHRVTVLPATNKVASIIKHVDGVLLASTYEGSPNVVLEAMASGTPAIVTTVGDVPNMIIHGLSGILIPSPEVDAVAAALARFHGMSAEDRRAMGLAARTTVEERHRIETVTDRYLRLYQDVAAPRR